MQDRECDEPGRTRGGDDPRRIAIVDDDASVRRSMCRLLGCLGYQADAFASGEEFLRDADLAQTACLLVDMRMPGMDGLELQRHVIGRGLRLPVVFFTGCATDEEERCARAAGAAGFLRKPVSEATLRQALQDVFNATQPVRGDGDDV